MGEWKPPEWYDAAYRSDPNLADHVGSTFAPLWDRIALEVPPNRHIVDVGCGTGPMLPRVAPLCLTYIGCDSSEQAIAAAQVKYPRDAPSFKFGIIEVALPFIWRRASACVVLAVEVLEHLEHDVEFIRACGPGCELIASLPSRDSESHLRHFASADEVLARYGPLLRLATCVPFDQWFILRGVTK